jgi:ATP-binding cassette subfamily F protein 3
MESIEALTEQMYEYQGAVVIVTHSEMILRDLATKLIVFNEGGAKLFLGSYDDFLEKIGWSDEPRPKPKAGKSDEPKAKQKAGKAK